MSTPIRILVVEDSEDDALLLLRELQHGGYRPDSRRVDTAKDMWAAIEAGQWDLVIANYVIPGFGGIAALEILRESGLDLPFILVTGKIGEETAVEVMRAGAHDCILKDRLARLVPAINRELREAQVRRQRREAVAKIEHLNKALHAIRMVNQLIVREEDEGRLIVRACELLTETRGYESAWISLFDEQGRGRSFAQSHFPGSTEQLELLMREKQYVPCVRRALEGRALDVVQEVGSCCESCPLKDTYAGRGALCAPLQYSGEVLGVLVVSLEPVWAVDHEEQSLFCEVAADLGLALHGIAAKQGREQAEERIKHLARFPAENPNPVFRIDASGTLMHANDAALAFLESLGDGELGEVPPALRELAAQALADNQRREADFETGGRCFSVLYVPVAGEQYVNVYCVDISARKQAEEALERSEMTLRVLFDGARDGILVADAESKRFVVANDAMCRMLGYGHDELLALSVNDIHPVEELPGVVVQFERQMRGEVSLAPDLPVKRKDGTIFFADVNASAVELRDRPCMIGVFRDVTERKRAEEELRLSEERFRIATESSNDLVYEWDLKQGIRWFGDIDEMLGYGRGEFPRTLDGWVEAVDPEDRDRVMAAVQAHLEGGASYDVEHRIRSKDGATRWWSARGAVAKSPDGSPIRWIGTITDITERKQLEQVIRESEARYRTALDNMLEGCQIIGFDWRYLYLNDSAARHGRRPKEDSLGRTMMEAYPGIETTGMFTALRQCMEDRTSQLLENEFLYPDGEKAWFELSMQPVPEGVFILSLDITERKRAERALQVHLAELGAALDQAKRLSSAVEQSGEAVVFTDLDCTITYVNPAFEAMTGYAKGEAIGATTRLLKSGKTKPEVYAELWESLLAGEVWRGRFVNRRKDGSLYDESDTISPVRNEAGGIAGYLAIKRDVTSELREEAELHQAQKLQAIGQLAAGIAHEINTPMQYVGDNTRFLADGLARVAYIIEATERSVAALSGIESLAPQMEALTRVLNDADLRYVLRELPLAAEQAIEGVERVTRIVGAMRDFSHPGQAEKVHFDINRAVESTVTVARNEWKYDAEVQLDLEAGLPSAWCAPGDINQALLNLILNAKDAIVEKRRQGSGEMGVIRISTALSGDWIELRVADNGTGIPESIRDRIFEPFFTSKEVGKGTGQGLAMVYATIVERHGGRVTFETETGVGTTFIVKLPVAANTVTEVEA